MNMRKLELTSTIILFCRDGFFAAASCMSFQQCRFNFGSEPFKYPPKSRSFDSFNSHAYLKEQDKIVLPRHLFLEQLRKLSVREDSCTLCFDLKGIVRLEPCMHRFDTPEVCYCDMVVNIVILLSICRGFCMTCASQLQFCPLCRAEILNVVKEECESPTPDEFLT